MLGLFGYGTLLGGGGLALLVGEVCRCAVKTVGDAGVILRAEFDVELALRGAGEVFGLQYGEHVVTGGSDIGPHGPFTHFGSEERDALGEAANGNFGVGDVFGGLGNFFVGLGQRCLLGRQIVLQRLQRRVYFGQRCLGRVDL